MGVCVCAAGGGDERELRCEHGEHADDGIDGDAERREREFRRGVGLELQHVRDQCGEADGASGARGCACDGHAVLGGDERGAAF